MRNLVSTAMRPDRVADETRRQRWLCRIDDHSAYAYARGHDFIRWSDHTLWAHLSAGKLLSARSGECLAYQIGNVFYDSTTHEPVYYQPT